MRFLARDMHNDDSVRSFKLPSLAFGLAAAAFAGLSANGVGCADQPGQLSGGTESTGANTTMSSGVGGGIPAGDPKQLFADLEADFVAACSTCHEPGGLADTPFLAPPDRY